MATKALVQQKFTPNQLKKFTYTQLKQLLPKGKLEDGSHDSPDEGVCLMEAVAWVAGEKHADHPECACPHLTELAISFNDRVSDADRQKLIPAIPFLVGSKNASARIRFKRAKLIMQHLVRQLEQELNKGNKAVSKTLGKVLSSLSLIRRNDFELVQDLLPVIEALGVDVDGIHGRLRRLLEAWGYQGRGSMDQWQYEEVFQRIEELVTKHTPELIVAVASVRS